MRYLKQISILIFLTVASTHYTYTQSSINIQAGSSIPIGNFSLYGISGPNYNLTDSPSLGIVIGLKYTYKIPDRNFGFFLGLDFICNNPNKQYIDSVTNLFDQLGHDMRETHKFYNIPFTLGLNYLYMIKENWSLEFGLGGTMNFLKVSDWATKYIRYQIDWTNNIGGKLGAGVIWKNRYSLHINFLYLGSHELTIKREDDPEGLLTSNAELKVQFLTITAGIRF